MIVLASGLVALAAACGPSTHELRGGKPPAWANRAPGGWLCTIDAKKGLCAMGMVSGIKQNAALRRDMTADKARIAMQQMWNTYSARLAKQYGASTTDNQGEASEQHVEEAMKTFTSGYLSGVEMRDYWEDGEGSAFAEAFLDIDDFKAFVDKADQLNAKTRQVIKANADKAFDELKAEEEKREVK